MKLLSISACAAVAAGLSVIGAQASAAPGDAAFKAFRSVCGETQGDFDAVQAASNTQGWKNTDVHATPMNGVTVSDELSRTKQVDGKDLTLMATRGTTRDGTGVSTCTVYADKSALAGVRAAAQKWMGFAPNGGSDASSSSFHFTADGGKLKPVDTQADMNAAATGPNGMRVLNIKLANDQTVIDEIKIKK
ncbi:MAG TPA: hypothetical protein VGS12_09085 [Caulobacteraceae bacterium]|nr:hypothetical protein [Caulobacteraceae bacterium]